MEVREICEADLDLICQHREKMFRDAGGSENVLQPMTQHFREWLRPRLQDGSYFGFVFSENAYPVAGIGLMLIDWPPHPSHPTQNKRGYVFNVYVEPAYRRRGLARALMQRAEAAFARRGVQFAVLHATAKGKGLYADMAWSGTTEMAKRITGA